MKELHELIENSDTSEYYTDKECRKKTVERFYYLYQPYVCLSDLPTEMGLKEGKYRFTDKDTLWFKSVKTIEQLSRILGKEESVGMEGKYDGYVTTMTKSPVYSNRWQPTLSEQPWQPAIGEPGWHAQEGEMGSRGQERPVTTFAIGERRGVESGPLRGADEKPDAKYIYCIILIPPKDSSIDVLSERDKLINVLRNKGFEVKAVYTDELSVYSEKLTAEFEDMFEPIYASTGIKCGYEVRCGGKAEPVVRCEEEDRK